MMIRFLSLCLCWSTLVHAFSPKPLFANRHHHHHATRRQNPRQLPTTTTTTTTTITRNMVTDPMLFWGGDDTAASLVQAALDHAHVLLSSQHPSLLLSDAAAATASISDLTDLASSTASNVASAAVAAVADVMQSASSSAASLANDVETATATAVTTPPAGADEGWWQAYLNIFKTTLVLVHETIDAPLRSIGVEHSWGISIALFTASVRALLVPLSIQQSKSSEYMKALKPYMSEIKEKFKNNKDMQNRAMAKLMEDANQNPLAGCFVSLAQIPVFLGLYRGVRLLAQEGRLQEPFLWIPSLEGPVSPPDYRGMDWLLQGWTTDAMSSIPHPSLGWPTTLAFLVMPLVLVLGQSVTMRVLQPPIDDSMSAEEKETMEKSQGFLKFLPLMIGFFSLQVPAGLTIYWFTSNIFTLSQSLAVRSYYKANPPKIELPDYWEALDDVANMSPEERRKAAEAGISTGPNFDDLMDEARFHYLVARQPLRADSTAWQRVQSTGSTSTAAELQEWAAAAAAVAASSSSSSSTVSATNPLFFADADTTNVTAPASTTA